MDTNDTPLFRSSPERIGLAFGDGSDDLWQMEFDDVKDATWYSGHPPVSVTLEYVRADLYENLKAEFVSFSDDVARADRKTLSFAMACVRDEDGITVGGALNRQREMIGELRAELAAANERADDLQRTINEALSQSPAATIVDIDDGLGTTFLEFNEPRGPAGTNYYAAPVPAQPAVVPTYEIVMSSGRKARLTATELVDRLATCRDEIERLRGERRAQPAVVPEGLHEFGEWADQVLHDGSDNHAPKYVYDECRIAWLLKWSSGKQAAEAAAAFVVSVWLDRASWLNGAWLCSAATFHNALSVAWHNAILSATDTDNKATEIFPGTADALAKLSIKPKE